MTQSLEELNMDKKFNSKKSYKKELKKLQLKMLTLQQTLHRNNIGLIIAFEGMDAAGKGGAIKRLIERLDPRGYVVHPISAPKPHELRHNYLQRFWRKLPFRGSIGIFDRSWYGRVLVERIEGFATDAEWTRAYHEINEFERVLTDDHYIILKFWLQITDEEQLNRFNARENDPYKSWKLTDEDWRNRKKWPQYVQAANDMFAKTDHPNAPWILVAGNDKEYARIKVLKETIKHCESKIKSMGIEIDYPDEK
ncbi:MAG: polyphosphate kinase 2 family protein [Kurthia gibsonii]|uniref:Polyphosphate kinase n=1 Tax=Kurthia gibsonii TaxID=33946 RepID=A0ABU9LRE2_9BACL|nr:MULTISPECIES: polyphosphate kinase [Kurthia]MCA9724158.1 polyphosphate kinase [Kurthia sp.]AMA63071.1 polyphosphate kinase 2 family protein [Kurthia sp. 11kri321]MEB7773363.1 polyphosphate kinase [Kurthia gibsonii]RXH51663.1 polyphosphate kinase [Kurthia gibsonii]HZG12388.1 polyphosphate kinase [Kurthia gibsonii]